MFIQYFHKYSTKFLFEFKTYLDARFVLIQTPSGICKRFPSSVHYWIQAISKVPANHTYRGQLPDKGSYQPLPVNSLLMIFWKQCVLVKPRIKADGLVFTCLISSEDKYMCQQIKVKSEEQNMFKIRFLPFMLKFLHCNIQHFFLWDHFF